jgi:hypothetical protein
VRVAATETAASNQVTVLAPNAVPILTAVASTGSRRAAGLATERAPERSGTSRDYREARQVYQAELDGDQPRYVAATPEHLAEHDVVDVVHGDVRALERLLDGEPTEVERAEADQRALAGGADRRAGSGHDDGVRHARRLPDVPVRQGRGLG